ncbi:multiple coagulation factor deficiency protein 2 homolog [Lineus longissimus]|uniref:multiple coagulation factor deficiency protein 2 homolog n=1 Tax=Lineus longissimus TaxID=88925 RepID=UPI002B4C6C09
MEREHLHCDAKMLLVLISVLTFLPFSLPHGSAHSRGGVLDQRMVEDAEHLQYHLREKGIKADAENMSEDEHLFYFFTLHDHDNSSSIDGLELYKGSNHHMYEMSENKEAKISDEELRKIDEDNIAEVDQRLREFDSNKDGFITWPELYIRVKQEWAKRNKEEAAQKAAEKM